jgi:hypothetical protein
MVLTVLNYEAGVRHLKSATNGILGLNPVSGRGHVVSRLSRLVRGISAVLVGYWRARGRGLRGKTASKTHLPVSCGPAPVLLSTGYGATELLACGFGKPLGYTEKQVMGPFALAH